MEFYKNKDLEQKDSKLSVEELSREYDLNKNFKDSKECVTKVEVTFKRVSSLRAGNKKPKIFVAIHLTEKDLAELNGAFEGKILETILRPIPQSEELNWWVDKITVNGWQLIHYNSNEIVYW